MRLKVIHELMCNFRLDTAAIGQEFGIDFNTFFADDLALLAEHERNELVTVTHGSDPGDADRRALRPEPRDVLRPLPAREARRRVEARVQPHGVAMRRLVVIGGGISGLAAAWRAKRDGRRVARRGRARARSGRSAARRGASRATAGSSRAARADSSAGDRRWTGSSPRAVSRRSCVPAQAAAAHRFLFRARPHARSGGGAGLPHVGDPRRHGHRAPARRAVHRRGAPTAADESVWQFAARRLGPQVADRLIAPMTLGIFAGDAQAALGAGGLPAHDRARAPVRLDHQGDDREAREHELGRAHLLPRRDADPAAAARGAGGLHRALRRRGARRCGRTPAAGRSRSRAAASRSPPTRCSSPASRGRWRRCSSRSTPRRRASWRGSTARRSPSSGSATGSRMRPACRTVSASSSRAGKGSARSAISGRAGSIRGGARRGRCSSARCSAARWIPPPGSLSPAELVAIARAEFARLYGIRAEPVMEEVVRWPRAIPQYALGHAAKALRIERAAAALGGLFITGYGMRAIAFADAATNGALCGERAAEYCRSRGRLNPGAAPRRPVTQATEHLTRTASATCRNHSTDPRAPRAPKSTGSTARISSRASRN